jgi:hypothetical protein
LIIGRNKDLPRKPEETTDSDNFDEEAYQKVIVKKVLQRIAVEKGELERNQKSSRNAGIAVFTVIATIFFYLNVSIIMNLIVISKLALIVEISGILLILISLMRYFSLRGEIAKITSDLESLETYKEIYSKETEFLMRKQHLELYGKIFDVKQNTINKMFGRLKTFSKTWLAVTGGIVSTALISILISTTIDAYSILVIAVTALLMFDVSQNMYGWLNYELSKKTKDLAFWWIALF